MVASPKPQFPIATKPEKVDQVAKRGRGRPKGSPNVKSIYHTRYLQEYARSFTTEAIDTILEVMRNKTEAGNVRVNAAAQLLDRGYGKPAQVQRFEDEDGKPLRVGVVFVGNEEAETIEDVEYELE